MFDRNCCNLLSKKCFCLFDCIMILEERDLNGNDDSAHQDEVDGSTLEESDRVISISKGEDPRNISSGWTPEVAAMVWLRMLGILGDVTKIPHPMELEQVMKQIEKIWINLEKVAFISLYGITSSQRFI